MTTNSRQEVHAEMRICDEIVSRKLVSRREEEISDYENENENENENAVIIFENKKKQKPKKKKT